MIEHRLSIASSPSRGNFPSFFEPRLKLPEFVGRPRLVARRRREGWSRTSHVLIACPAARQRGNETRVAGRCNGADNGMHYPHEPNPRCPCEIYLAARTDKNHRSRPSALSPPRLIVISVSSRAKGRLGVAADKREFRLIGTGVATTDPRNPASSRGPCV